MSNKRVPEEYAIRIKHALGDSKTIRVMEKVKHPLPVTLDGRDHPLDSFEAPVKEFRGPAPKTSPNFAYNPNGAPKFEIRGNKLVRWCKCQKKNGLQDECPRLSCVSRQGNDETLTSLPHKTEMTSPRRHSSIIIDGQKMKAVGIMEEKKTAEAQNALPQKSSIRNLPVPMPTMSHPEPHQTQELANPPHSNPTPQSQPATDLLQEQPPAPATLQPPTLPPTQQIPSSQPKIPVLPMPYPVEHLAAVPQQTTQTEQTPTTNEPLPTSKPHLTTVITPQPLSQVPAETVQPVDHASAGSAALVNVQATPSEPNPIRCQTCASLSQAVPDPDKYTQVFVPTNWLPTKLEHPVILEQL